MTPYAERVLKQAEEWYAGNSRHNDVDGECCIDFSCCFPQLYERDRGVRLKILNDLRSRLGLPKRYAS